MLKNTPQKSHEVIVQTHEGLPNIFNIFLLFGLIRWVFSNIFGIIFQGNIKKGNFNLK